MARRGRGRRPGNPETAEQILAAARDVFSKRGVAGATIRGIAARARVDPALVLHFFGSKAGLLEAAIDWPFDVERARSEILSGELCEVGFRLARLFVQTWDQAGPGHPILLLLRVAGTEPTAATRLTDLLSHRLVGPLWPALQARYGSAAPCDGWPARGGMLASQLLGLALTRYVLNWGPVSTMAPSEVAAWAGPSLQSILTGPPPGIGCCDELPSS